MNPAVSKAWLSIGVTVACGESDLDTGGRIATVANRPHLSASVYLMQRVQHVPPGRVRSVQRRSLVGCGLDHVAGERWEYSRYYV